MNIIRVVQGLLFGTMLTLSACGGPVPVEQPSEAIGQRQDAISYHAMALKTTAIATIVMQARLNSQAIGNVTAMEIRASGVA